jgi:hypothetical protein
VVVVHPATRKAHTIKLPRRTAGAAVTVAVFAEARLRLTRANPKFHKGHKDHDSVGVMHITDKVSERG